MDKFDWEEYLSDKKNAIMLITLLAILAFFVVRNSVLEIKNQWLEEKLSIIDVNNVKIESDITLINNISEKKSPKSPEVIKKYDLLLTEMKDYSFKNLYIYYVDFKDPQMTKTKLQELRAFVEANKSAPSHDKIIAEIDDFYKNVSKYKEDKEE